MKRLSVITLGVVSGFSVFGCLSMSSGGISALRIARSRSTSRSR